MITFILAIHSRKQNVSARAILERIGTVREEDGGRIVVEGPNGMADGWMAITPFDIDGGDYDPDSLGKLKALLLERAATSPSFFLVEGRDTKTSFADRLVQALNLEEGKKILDNDHGLIADIGAVNELINKGVDWLTYSPDQ